MRQKKKDFWTNPFKKCRFFKPFKTSIFWSKSNSFLSRISKNNIF